MRAVKTKPADASATLRIAIGGLRLAFGIMTSYLHTPLDRECKGIASTEWIAKYHEHTDKFHKAFLDVTDDLIELVKVANKELLKEKANDKQ